MNRAADLLFPHEAELLKRIGKLVVMADGSDIELNLADQEDVEAFIVLRNLGLVVGRRQPPIGTVRTRLTARGIEALAKINNHDGQEGARNGFARGLHRSMKGGTTLSSALLIGGVAAALAIWYFIVQLIRRGR